MYPERLSIARAIAKKPEILIFDDSFSALDYKTDVTLRRELKKQTADTTTLIVAQRISTILHADQIIKAIWCVFRLRSGKWIKKIKTETTE